MKTRFILDCSEELDFIVLGINSHVKSYKLCWSVNKALQLNLEKKQDHNIQGDLWFSRFSDVCNDGVEYNLLANRSKKGYLIPEQKSVTIRFTKIWKRRGFLMISLKVIVMTQKSI